MGSDSAQTERSRRGKSLGFVLVPWALATLFLLVLASCRAAPSAQYELWAIDQADAAKGGAKLYIFKGANLDKGEAGTPEVVDLDAGAKGVGAGPGTRPHALAFNNKLTHAIVANVASGHVYFMRLQDRKIVASIDVGEQAHWAAAAPDDSFVLAANQNGKKLARIKADFEKEQFSHNPAEDLDLKSLEDAGHPDNAPICPLLFAAGTKQVYITLRGGGLLVVDASTTPMKVVKSLAKDEIAPAGCGGIALGEKVYINSGTATSGHVYVFDKNNTLKKTLTLTSLGTDAHGMILTGGGRYLWVGNRGNGDNIVVLDTKTDEIAGTISPVGSAPDIMDVSPHGRLAFVALRSANPLTGGAPAKGEKPGIQVMEITEKGTKGVQKLFIPIGDQSPQSPNDVHALAVRRIK